MEKYPGIRLLRTGSNLGYGTAVNRGVATVPKDQEFVIVANPDVTWGRAASIYCWKPLTAGRRPPAWVR